MMKQDRRDDSAPVLSAFKHRLNGCSPFWMIWLMFMVVGAGGWWYQNHVPRTSQKPVTPDVAFSTKPAPALKPSSAPVPQAPTLPSQPAPKPSNDGTKTPSAPVPPDSPEVDVVNGLPYPREKLSPEALAAIASMSATPTPQSDISQGPAEESKGASVGASPPQPRK
jgi:cytoskeletal protein RodZ